MPSPFWESLDPSSRDDARQELEAMLDELRQQLIEAQRERVALAWYETELQRAIVNLRYTLESADRTQRR
ncbi:MAG TPA: hypothetical protein VD833_03020 [Vicinamibacterales bacterium]|nr:hypothetical protein [Vicinamibacterales bacterium]